MRTTASRRWNTAWNRFWLFPTTGLLASVLLSETAGAPAGVGVALGVWLACLILAAGGALVGVLAARDPSSPRLATALLAPIPILAFAGLMMLGLSESDDDPRLAGLIPAVALLLFDLPLAVAFRLSRHRLGEHGFAAVVTLAPSAQDRELELATDFGRATTVVREYVSDDEGRRHLEVDTKALEARGYGRVSVEGTRLSGADVAVAAVIVTAVDFGPNLEAKIIATFRLLPGVEPRPPAKKYWT